MSIVPSQKKVPAGILALIFGGLGVHKFFLGMYKEGFLMLTLTIVGWTLACLHLYPLAVAMSLIGFIEGIIYLTKSDQDFYLDYIVKKKGWF